MKGLKSAFLFLLLLILFVPLRAQSPDFPLDHWVYSFLERLEAKGVLTEVFDGTRPIPRDELAAYLNALLSNPQKMARLNSVEKQEVKTLIVELREYLPRKGEGRGRLESPRLMALRRWRFLGKILPNHLYANGRNFFSYSEADFRAFLDPVLYRRGIWSHSDSASPWQANYRDSHGVTAWGLWGRRLSFFFDFRDSKIWGDKRYPKTDLYTLPGVGYANSLGSYVYFDETRAGFVFGGKHWQILVGKERNAWGPGFWGQLALSAHPTSYDEIKFQVRFSKFKFTSIAAVLRPYPEITAYSYFTGHFQRNVWAHKYMAAHRLEAFPFPRLRVGLHEVLIYGERNPELAYLNPINFYWSAEHNLGDQDNSTLGADMVWFPGWAFKVYGEIFLDDLRTGSLGTGWYGNKWALLGGVFRPDVLGIPNLDFRAEMAKIRPYVYTHRYPINVYEHFLTPLGHWAGPNSQTLNVSLTWRPSRWLVGGLAFQSWKHGANPADKNVGGDINLPHRAIDSQTVKFFEGDVENRQQTSVWIAYEWFRNFVTRLEIRRRVGKNVPLNTGSRGTVTSVDGFFSAGLNF